MKKYIPIPNYKLSEEIINAITHGIGALLSIVGLILLIIKSSHHSKLAIVTCTIFGATMIILYTMSCIYHSLSKNTKGKGILRIIDHCNVYLLVFGTYFPISILGVKGKLGIILIIFVGLFSILGIILTIINIKKYQLLSVICHLICGWSIIIGISNLINNITITGTIFLILGGIFYTIGAILFGIGSKINYIHSIFHIFCLLGTLFHFLCIYNYIL